MKKSIIALLAILATTFVFGSCELFDGNFGNNSNSDPITSEESTGGESSDDSSLNGGESASPDSGNTEKPEDSGNTEKPEDTTPTPPTTGGDSGSTGGDSGSTGGEQGGTTGYTYTQFTTSEKALFNEYFGWVIPFAPNNEYYVEEYTAEGEAGINFYTYDNTSADFNAYKALFSTANGYTYDGTSDDEYGDAWYFYSKGDVYVDLSYYNYDGSDLIDVYVYTLSSTEGGGSEEGGDTPTTPTTPTTAGEILAAAYDLKSGESLSGTYELTGKVTNIKQTGTDEACLTFVVDGYSQYPMYCYWLKGAAADELSVGDIITVSGKIKNYNGLVEFEKPTLVSYESGSTGGDSGSTGYTYTDFSASEKALFNEYFGWVIPFAPNNEYYVEEYTAEGEEGLNFYTYGNTSADFDAYKSMFSAANGYTYDGTSDDEYGDAWYFYSKGNVCVDISYYYYEGDDVIDVYVYVESTTGGGSTGGGDISGGDTPTTPVEGLITNADKGLPTSNNGVYDVDFTKATYTKNVTEQGYYIDGCPTVGKPSVLVVPVQFSDVTAASKGYTIEKIEKAFNGVEGDTDYHSVHDYYYTSSYGKLDVQFTVLDSWFTPKYASSYYKSATFDYYGESVEAGEQIVMDEVLASLEGKMDLTQFDSDRNGIIDAIVLINTLEIDSDVTFQWAFRYWNYYVDSDGNYREYDGVSANDYLWASYQFMHEGTSGFNDKTALNTYTYIHEFGHVLGADDYYDTSYNGGAPMDGYDIMDSMSGDHNAYTKFHYGWLTSSRLVVAEESVTLTLEDFSKNGDTIIIANNWDETLGAYQEYYVVVYYTNNGLNSGVGGYFDENGIVVYHVNASLIGEAYDSEMLYDVYNNNTDGSDEYGTEDNLIELVKSASGDYVHTQGVSSSSSLVDDQGNKISYAFTVDSLTSDSATLTFTKNN